MRCVRVNELLHLETHGEYHKSAGEDERSMWTGLVGQKGPVHLEFGNLFIGRDAPDVKPERKLAQAFSSCFEHEGLAQPNLAAEALGVRCHSTRRSQTNPRIVHNGFNAKRPLKMP